LVVPLLPGFQQDNQLLVRNGGAEQVRTVLTASHDTGANLTTLQVDSPLAAALPAGVATVTLQAPAVWEAPPLFAFGAAPPAAPLPALYVTFLDAREHLERTGYYQQRDSFRPRGGMVVCSTRPAARAYTVDYQLTAVASNRQQQRWLQEELLRHLSMDEGLRINGAPAPLQLLAPPELDQRRLGELGPLYIRIGTRQERAPRQEQTWVRIAEIQSGHTATPWDKEVVTLEF
jgi:hypothetical protein